MQQIAGESSLHSRAIYVAIFMQAVMYIKCDGIIWVSYINRKI